MIFMIFLPVVFSVLFYIVGYACGRIWPRATLLVEIAVLLLLLYVAGGGEFQYNRPIHCLKSERSRISASELNAELDNIYSLYTN